MVRKKACLASSLGEGRYPPNWPFFRLRAGTSSHVSLLLELDVLELLSGSHHVLVLDAHDTTSPDSAELLGVVVLVLELLGQRVEIADIFLADVSHGNACGRLEVAEFPEVGFSTEEAEGDSLLPAEGREEDDHLDRVDVMGDDDELGPVLLDKGGHMVQAILEVDWLGGLATAALLGFLLQALLLVLLGFGTVFGKQFKELGS